MTSQITIKCPKCGSELIGWSRIDSTKKHCHGCGHRWRTK